MPWLTISFPWGTRTFELRPATAADDVTACEWESVAQWLEDAARLYDERKRAASAAQAESEVKGGE